MFNTRHRAVFRSRLSGTTILCIVAPLMSFSMGCKGVPRSTYPDDAVGQRWQAAPTPVHRLLQLSAIGEVKGYRTVVVRSLVDGQIVALSCRDGQDVEEGDLVATIDSTSYRISLDRALAARDKDLAELNEARSVFARHKELFAEGIIAKQEFEKQEAASRTAEASVSADQSEVDRATLELSRTKIFAPISGRVGFGVLDVGNIARTNDSGGILTLTQLQPIAVVFSLPADRLYQIVDLMRKNRLRVEAFSYGSETLLDEGKILSVAPEIDSTTGFARFKAVFPNTNRSLLPNQFVRIRIYLEPST